MDMYGQKSKSIPQKLIMTVLQVLMVAGGGWILFGGGFDWIYSKFGYSYTEGNWNRRMVLMLFNGILFIRMNITLFYFVKRRIPWEETLSVPMAFAIYYIGYAMLGYQAQSDLGFIDAIAILTFSFGSYLNTFSELKRHFWKKKPENQGKLYTLGLFRYSMHINYFGDLLWVLAYAMITQNIFAFVIPVFIFCFFAFFNIPKLDKYLAEKYSDQFPDYARKTKKFIPFIY